jgi:protein-tyrosine-phosphatase
MKVLFVCKFNVGRSQMAEAFFNKLSKKNHSTSCGVDPYYVKHYHAKVVNYPKSKVIDVMAEKGIDISKNSIKMADRKMVENADMVIAIMSSNRAKRDLPKYIINSPKFRLWEVEDANAKYTSSMYEAQSRNRDKISMLVKKLVKEIG